MLDALQEFLSPYRTTLDALFRHCCLTGRGAGQFEAEAMNSMGPVQASHYTLLSSTLPLTPTPTPKP